MEVIEQARFNTLYHEHVRALKLKGHADKTIEAYSQAVRRLTEYLGRCPDEVTKDELDAYFARLIETHLMGSGLTLSAIQHQLGHSCPKTTARYVRMTEKTAGDAQAMIDTLVSDLASTLRAMPTREEKRS